MRVLVLRLVNLNRRQMEHIKFTEKTAGELSEESEKLDLEDAIREHAAQFNELMRDSLEERSELMRSEVIKNRAITYLAVLGSVVTVIVIAILTKVLI